MYSTNGIVGHIKSNLASNDFRRYELAHSLYFYHFYMLKDSEVLLTPINEISHSKEMLILYGHVQGFMD